MDEINFMKLKNLEERKKEERKKWGKDG